MESENNKNEKLELTQQENKMVQDFLKVLNNDIKELLLIQVASVILGQNKLASRNLISNWMADSIIHQRKNVQEIYDRLTDAQKHQTISVERYMELFAWSANSVKSNWEKFLGLSNFIITN